jgi:hypothetical protein
MKKGTRTKRRERKGAGHKGANLCKKLYLFKTEYLRNYYYIMIPHNSQKNNKKYSHNGYCYVKERESGDGEKIFWRCDLKTYIGCKANLDNIL